MDLFTNTLLLLQRAHMNEGNAYVKYVLYYKLWGVCYALICLRRGFLDPTLFNNTNKLFSKWYYYLAINDSAAIRYQLLVQRQLLYFTQDINTMFQEADRVLATDVTFDEQLGVDMRKTRGSFSVFRDGIDYVYLPSFAIAESSDVFIDRYKKEFPFLLTDYSELYNKMQEFKKEDVSRVRKKYDSFMGKVKKDRDEKKIIKEKKLKEKELLINKRRMGVEEKKQYKILLGKQAYELYVGGNNNFNNIGKQLGVVDRNKIMRWAILYAQSINDPVFIRAVSGGGKDGDGGKTD